MPLNRRTALKTLLMTPFFGVARKLGASGMQPPTVSGFVNILLHGLFFIELDNTDTTNPLLVISAPKLTDHVFLAGMRRNLQPVSNLNWSTGFGLQGGVPSFMPNETIPTQVITSILQFTKAETGVGPLKPDSGLYFGKVTLPFPRNFFSLRLDNFPQFDPNKQNVSPKIRARCGGNKIGVVTCLQYKYVFSGPVLPSVTPTMNLHLHMVPCKGDDIGHVNSALTDAGKIFTTPNFDLQTLKSVGTSIFDNVPPVLGVSPEDERSASEDEDTSQWCANPPISSKLKKSATGDKIGMGMSKADTGGGGVVGEENVNPANCPHFYLG